MYVKRKRAQIHTVLTRNLPQGKVGRFMSVGLSRTCCSASDMLVNLAVSIYSEKELFAPTSCSCTCLQNLHPTSKHARRTRTRNNIIIIKETRCHHSYQHHPRQRESFHFSNSSSPSSLGSRSKTSSQLLMSLVPFSTIFPAPYLYDSASWNGAIWASTSSSFKTPKAFLQAQ